MKKYATVSKPRYEYGYDDIFIPKPRHLETTEPEKHSCPLDIIAGIAGIASIAASICLIVSTIKHK